jgi:hypothetical protein
MMPSTFNLNGLLRVSGISVCFSMEFPPERQWIFVPSNRTNMLHTISWKEYFTSMGLGFLVYYGW